MRPLDWAYTLICGSAVVYLAYVIVRALIGAT
jgi:hypothetical protein